MAKEQSVAPRERINIVYKPATGGATEEQELPLKLLVLGDFTMREDARPLEEREPVKIDKDTFNQVMEKQDLSLSFVVPDRLSGQPGATLTVNLPIRTDRDLSPDHIAAQVPELQALLEIREALKWLRGPLGNKREFRRRIEASLKDEKLRQRLFQELGIESHSELPESTPDSH
jgi:type VI secretion system protein ImpB